MCPPVSESRSFLCPERTCCARYFIWVSFCWSIYLFVCLPVHRHHFFQCFMLVLNCSWRIERNSKDLIQLVDLSKTCPIFSEWPPGTEMTVSECSGAKVRATVHRDGYKNRPGLMPYPLTLPSARTYPSPLCFPTLCFFHGFSGSLVLADHSKIVSTRNEKNMFQWK